MNIPDFSENGGIIPDIRWSWSEYINEDGTTNRPSYTESPFSEYKDTTVSATLTHPLFPDVSIPPKQYSIAIQREDVTDEELLVQAVQIFQSYFIDFGRRDITNTLSYPTLPVWVQVTWENVASYISASGDVTRPSFNQWNEEITLKAKFTHPDAASPKYVANIKLNILKQTCNGTSQTIIWTWTNQTCYDLVAAAEYDNESYKLWTLNPSNQENKPGFVTIDGKTWINPLSSDWSYLSYNLSSLDLSDDWAIEMSVRGEDLNRNDYFYNLLDIRDNNDNQHNFQITRISWDRKFSYRYNDTPASYFNRSSNYNSWYKDILIQGNKLSTDRDSVVINIPLEIKNIYLWTKSDQSAQWNWLINYLKLYKKN
jgi:hypothetical protein